MTFCCLTNLLVKQLNDTHIIWLHYQIQMYMTKWKHSLAWYNVPIISFKLSTGTRYKWFEDRYKSFEDRYKSFEDTRYKSFEDRYKSFVPRYKWFVPRYKSFEPRYKYYISTNDLKIGLNHLYLGSIRLRPQWNCECCHANRIWR